MPTYRHMPLHPWLRHPLVRDLLTGVGRAGVRAGVAAFDSLLGEVEEVVGEVGGRVKKARGRAKQITTDTRGVPVADESGAYEVVVEEVPRKRRKR